MRSSDAAESTQYTDLALAAVREQIAALEGSANLRVVALAALVGRSAAELPPLQPKPLPAASGNLPDNVKIDLISRRPDITASRWRVEAAEKNLDEARAEFFPDVSINALVGLSAIDVSKLLEYGSRVPQASASPFICRYSTPAASRRATAQPGRDRFGRGELPRHAGQRRPRCRARRPPPARRYAAATFATPA